MAVFRPVFFFRVRYYFASLGFTTRISNLNIARRARPFAHFWRSESKLMVNFHAFQFFKFFGHDQMPLRPGNFSQSFFYNNFWLRQKMLRKSYIEEHYGKALAILFVKRTSIRKCPGVILWTCFGRSFSCLRYYLISWGSTSHIVIINSPRSAGAQRTFSVPIVILRCICMDIRIIQFFGHNRMRLRRGISFSKSYFQQFWFTPKILRKNLSRGKIRRGSGDFICQEKNQFENAQASFLWTCFGRSFSLRSLLF